jgi:hypothetical protein
MRHLRIGHKNVSGFDLFPFNQDELFSRLEKALIWSACELCYHQRQLIGIVGVVFSSGLSARQTYAVHVDGEHAVTMVSIPWLMT